MAALKPAEIEGFLARPGDRYSIVVIYGPDDGLVSERATRLVKSLTGGVDDPFSLVRLDGPTLTQDPARLVDEASTVSMFGGRRVVWVRDTGGRSNILPATEPLFDHPDRASVVVIEAGDLKKGTGLRKRAEDHPNAAAIACYADSAADLSRLITEETARNGLAIEPDAKAALEHLIGSDRLASRGEIAKLCLYAHGQGRIRLADVEAVVGDASALAQDELIDAVAGGDPAGADRIFARMTATGTPASVVAGAVIRHFQLLQRLRTTVDRGQSPSQAVDQAQPPVFFKRKDALARQLSQWPQARLIRALALLDDAILTSRMKPAIADTAMSDTLLQLARAARAGRRSA